MVVGTFVKVKEVCSPGTLGPSWPMPANAPVRRYCNAGHVHDGFVPELVATRHLPSVRTSVCWQPHATYRLSGRACAGSHTPLTVCQDERVLVATRHLPSVRTSVCW